MVARMAAGLPAKFDPARARDTDVLNAPLLTRTALEPARLLALKGAQVIGVTPTAVADANKAGLGGIRVIPDPEHKLYRELGAFGTGPRHGVAVLDAAGRVVFKASGDQPFTDAVSLRIALDTAARQGSNADCSCTPPTTLNRVRKNIDCLSPEELASYKHALDVLKKRSAMNPNDPTGYDWQVRIHGDRLIGPCKHNSELIWPWHRAMLFYFEETLRAADPDHPTLSTRNVTIPYWDWTKAPSGTGGYPAAYEDPASPLFHLGRNVYSAMSPPTLFTEDDTGIDLTDWGLFGGTTTGPGKLEGITHNDGHSKYVGGDMGSTATSPKDPIFFSHHANLDRLWDLWQQTHGVNPVQQTVSLRGWAAGVVPAAIVSNFNDIRGQLGYDYCHPAQQRILELRLPSKSAGPLSLDAPLKELRPARPIRTSTAQVRLTGVSVPRDFSYSVRVYLHPDDVPFKPDDPAFRRQYLADRFTVWADSIGDHGTKTIDLNLDVSRVYEPLAKIGANLKVSFDFSRLDKGKTTAMPWGTPGIEIGGAKLVANPTPFHTRK